MEFLGVRGPTHRFPDPARMGYGPHGGRHDPYQINMRLKQRRKPKAAKIHLTAGLPPGYGRSLSAALPQHNTTNNGSAARPPYTWPFTNPWSSVPDVDPRLLEHIRSGNASDEPPQWWLDEFRAKFPNPYNQTAIADFPPPAREPSVEEAKILAKIREKTKLTVEEQDKKLRRAADPVYDREHMKQELKEKLGSLSRQHQRLEEEKRRIVRERPEEFDGRRNARREQYMWEAQEKLIKNRRGAGDLSGYLYYTPQEMETVGEMRKERRSQKGNAEQYHYHDDEDQGCEMAPSNVRIVYVDRESVEDTTEGDERRAQWLWKRDDPTTKALRELAEYPDGAPRRSSKQRKRKSGQTEQYPRKQIRWEGLDDISQSDQYGHEQSANYDDAELAHLARTQLQHSLADSLDDAEDEHVADEEASPQQLSGFQDDSVLVNEDLEDRDGNIIVRGKSKASGNPPEWRKNITE